MRTVNVIAELGSNPAAHAWYFDPFCRAAFSAGANAVKVQLWKTEHFPFPESESKRSWEFPRALLPEFVAHAHRRGLRAGASVFDAEAVDMAAAQCDFLKLAAREQENTGLRLDCLSKHSKYNKMTYRSISETNGYTPWGNEITLCTVQQYPASMARSLIALLAWRLFLYSLEDDGPVEWGWSSHSRSALDCVLAARLGASVIEKHLALSKADPEGGHSLLPDEFGRMVSQIRRITNVTR